MSRPLLAILRLSRAGAHGSVSASIENGMLHVRVLQDGVASWSWSTSPMTAALWIAGPPIALWLAWMIARSRQARRGWDARPLAAPMSAGDGVDDITALPSPGPDPSAERTAREPSIAEPRQRSR
ncbi:MAG: hypothetical protein IRY91_16140 [Gemmatimonadaceae bacterium]|nr:hypothetical protein [Gemmatimonadaceae bacterium]